MSKKIKIILGGFILILFLTMIPSMGFSKNDKVVTKIKSYFYVEDWSNGVNPYMRGYKRKNETEYIPAKQTATYLQKMDYDGICKVKYDGKEYYIKETNLKLRDDSLDTEKTAKKVVDQYKNKSVNDFVAMGKDALKSASDKAIKAKNMATETSTKLELNAIIGKMAEAARQMGLSVDGNNIIQHQIPAASNTPSGDQAWQDDLDQTIQETTDQDTPNPGNDQIYQQPIKTSSGTSSEESLDDMMSDADSFVDEGRTQYNDESLQNFSKTLFNIMLSVGVVVAVIVGAIIGIKLMSSGIETKVEAKKLLIPYFVGCIVVFGGFGIWKIVVTLLSGM